MIGRDRRRRRTAVGALWLLALACGLEGGAFLIRARAAEPAAAKAPTKEPVKGKFTPAERMTRPRLKAARDDVQRLRATRRDVPPLPGLNDYRAILHAHAEDSAHTGGTRPEALADAKKVGVDAILLSNHFRPPVDFMTESWRGLHDGVLFIPGSEWRGFLILPMQSIYSKMEKPLPEFVDAVRADGGLIFLSHVEERPEHSMENLTGLEIYNRHYDAKKDAAGIALIFLKLTDPASLKELEENLKEFPDEMLAAQTTRADDYLAKWDAETRSRRLTGVAANDCHHNQILIMKMVDAETVLVGTSVDRDDQMRAVQARFRPGIRKLTQGRAPGDVLARLDFDPYFRAFNNAGTHILAPELTEPAIRSALREGRAYVSHDWMCDPRGFQYEMTGGGGPPILMGGEAKFAPGRKLQARFPQTCTIRLLSGGATIAETTGDRLEHAVAEPGVYRIEARLDVGGESRPWIYSNPIYVR